MTAATAQPAPNAAAPPHASVKRGASRPAASSDPAIVPTAMAENSSPYCPAPAPNTLTAMVEMKIVKFSPNVPTRPSIASTASRSGRAQT